MATEAALRSSTGLASGLDTAGIIDAMVSIQKIPMGDIQKKIDNAKVQKEAFKIVTTNLLTAKLGFSTLRHSYTFNNKTVSSTDESILLGASTSATPVGTYSFEVSQTASAAAFYSSGFTSDDTPIGAGTMELAFGSRNLGKSTIVDELNNGQGISRGEISITDGSGNTESIDLSRAVDVDSVLEAINNSGLDITASISDSGDKLVLTDGTGGDITVNEVSGGTTASDLGILGTATGTLTGSDIHGVNNSTSIAVLNDGLGITLGTISVEDGDDNSADITLKGKNINNVGDLISVLNSELSDNSINITASLSDDGNSIKLEDSSSGGGDMVFTDKTAGGIQLGTVAEGLGLDTGEDGVSSTSLSGRVVAGLNDVLLRNLAGINKTGIRTGDITIETRDGSSTTVDLSSAETLQDVIKGINNSGASVQVSINKNGNGIQLRDTTGDSGDLKISGDMAEDLGIDNDPGTEVDEVIGGDLDMAIFSGQTKMENFNGGKGINEGIFNIKDRNGTKWEVEINVADKTLDDVIAKINSKAGTAVTASINDTGDGIKIVDTTGGSGSLQITDGTSGTAKSLNLLTSPISDSEINGSYDFQITTNSEDTLETLQTKIDAKSDLLNASIIQTGAGSTPYRLSINSEVAGESAAITIDSAIDGLSFTQTTKAQDALVFMGVDGANANPLLIKSGSNKVKNIVSGLTLDIKSASDKKVTLNVKRDTDSLVEKMQSFVDQLNQVLEDINTLTKFEVGDDLADGTADKEGKEESTAITKGVLYGNSAIRRVQNKIFDMLSNPVKGTSGAYTGFYSVGIRLDTDGTIKYDEKRFKSALDNDISAVEKLFTYEANVGSSAEGSYISATTDDDYDAQNVINGNEDSASFGSTNGWQNSNWSSGDYLELNFGKVRNIDSLTMYQIDTPSMPAAKYGWKDFTLQYFDKNLGQWQDQVSTTDNALATNFFSFPETLHTDRIRFKIDALGDDADGVARLVEVQTFENRGLGDKVNGSLDDIVNSFDGLTFAESDRIDQNISDYEDRLSTIEDRAMQTKLRLQRQFDAMETAMSQLQSQSASFQGML